MADFLSFDTLSLHAGQTLDKEFGSRAQPIHQTTSYVFPDTDTASSLFNLERGGHVYNRISNPTIGVLEQRVAALEGGSASVCVSSGMSAVFCALTAIVSQGDHIVASANMYGGNISLLKNTLPRFGITTTFLIPQISNLLSPPFKKIPKSYLVSSSVILVYQLWILKALLKFVKKTICL